MLSGVNKALPAKWTDRLSVVGGSTIRAVPAGMREAVVAYECSGIQLDHGCVSRQKRQVPVFRRKDEIAMIARSSRNPNGIPIHRSLSHRRLHPRMRRHYE
jgi:hypothetical protein